MTDADLVNLIRETRAAQRAFYRFDYVSWKDEQLAECKRLEREVDNELMRREHQGAAPDAHLGVTQ